MRTDATTTRPAGLLAPSDPPARSALQEGVLVGSAVSTALLLASILSAALTAGMNEGLLICLTCIVAGLAGGLLQQVWFNPRVLGARLPYPTRVPLFGLSYLAVLAGCALVGGWLPPMARPWVLFVILYLVILATMTLVYRRSYRRQLSEYARRLEEYRRGERG